MTYLRGELGGERPMPFLVILNQRDYSTENLDVLRWMRTDLPLRETPVVVLAAKKFRDEDLEARRLHARWYAVSPNDFPRLLEWAQTVSYSWVRKCSPLQSYVRFCKSAGVFTPITPAYAR